MHESKKHKMDDLDRILSEEEEYQRRQRINADKITYGDILPWMKELHQHINTNMSHVSDTALIVILIFLLAHYYKKEHTPYCAGDWKYCFVSFLHDHLSMIDAIERINEEFL